MAEADGARWWRGGDEVIIDADLVDRRGRGLVALEVGREGGAQAGEVLRGQELEFAAGGRHGDRCCQLRRHCVCVCCVLVVLVCGLVCWTEAVTLSLKGNVGSRWCSVY